MTAFGTWVPAAPSRYAKPSARAGYAARTTDTSNAMEAVCRRAVRATFEHIPTQTNTFTHERPTGSECRRSRLPFGGTLFSSGLGYPDGPRRASPAATRPHGRDATGSSTIRHESTIPRRRPHDSPAGLGLLVPICGVVNIAERL